MLDSHRKLSPESLERFALENSLDDFLVVYGDTAFLLVTIGSTATELRQGLVACEQGNGSGASSVSAGAQFRTSTAELGAVRGAPASSSSQTMDEGGLGVLLRLSPHYAVTLRKRAAQGTDLRISVGRSSTCDIVLRDARVSKVHAWFDRDDSGAFVLADGNSSNGTFLDGERLAPGQNTQVPEGRVVHFGNVHAFVVYPATLWTALQHRGLSTLS